ncbi:MAG TPA: TonB-dependent receptor [Rhodanobacteraceae bacterium]|nr:TonB-dependent receptor [Rhodanobacteraceae bacterium]
MRSKRSGERGVARIASARPIQARLLLLAATLASGTALAQGSLQDLASLSLQDLGKIVVTSVAKNPEPLSDAPAAVYVITHDEIMRSGATTLPEILRLAPNLGVFQLSPSNYIVTSRGLSGNQDAENFPNKLLVLIDGRSVYSPLFSGIFWDQQYVLPENIDRIEVINGPAGALWGANAVNGVINIITRKASDTQGGLVEFGYGNHESSASFQYGGKLGANAWYRVYAHDFYQRSFDDSAGQNARDRWSAPQAGFRIDWDVDGADSVMLEGNILHSREGQPDAPDVQANGGNLLARWRHVSNDGSGFQLQTYFDDGHSGPSLATGGGTVTTWDVEAQQDFALGDRHHITWGAGDRIYRYRAESAIRPGVSLFWNPASGTQNLANVFVQDQVALGPRAQATLGVKAEHDPYSGWSWMPSARLAWKVSDSTLLWASAARSVRTPTVFDTSVLEIANTPNGPLNLLDGNREYRSEKLTAYEAGLRTQWATRFTLSLSLYYNAYDDLRAIILTPVTVFPFVFGNDMQGHTYGADLWAGWSVTDWWKLGAGLGEEREYFRVRPGAGGDASMAGDDPGHRAYLRSSMNLGSRWMLDADLREVGELPNPQVPAYTELNARLGWKPNDRLELSLSGMNLLHPWHQEYPGGDRIGRTVFLDARLKF